MQHIQDKDLDQLFKATFEDAEIAPSANLWTAIEQGINPKKKKRSLPVFWMAAASIAVVLTLTLVFNKEEKIKMQGSTLAATPPSDNTTITNQLTDTEPKASKVSLASAKTNRSALTVQKTVAVAQTPEPQQKDDVLPQTVIAKVDAPKQEQKTESVIAQQPTEQKEEVVYAQVDPTPVNKDVLNDNEQTERKGIRNVGDLVNFVVDKVDKRDKKAIRFKTEDDESSLIGINIGFLKFNSKKKDK